MKKTGLYIKAISLTLLGLCIVQIVVSNRLSTTGIALSKLEEKIQSYKEENAVLKEKLLITSSFTTIASSASTLGFVNTKSQYILGSYIPIALRQ